MTAAPAPQAGSSTGAERGRESDSLPRIGGLAVRMFRRYVRGYLRRHFDALRVSRGAEITTSRERSLVFFLNHPSWWDPLICFHLAHALFPERRHYAPIDAAMLERYRFFARLGFFGVDPKTARGARTLLSRGTAICADEATALWITPQGRFADPRERPPRLEPGLGWLAAHLARNPGTARTQLVPIALEYPFWEERLPEALVLIGDPLPLDGFEGDAAAWNARAAAALGSCQDRLAELSVRRDPGAFATTLEGRGGITFFYDTWQRLRAKIRGDDYHARHGERG
jgi:1-acyl-sn-glycerol-3-phosphate acyltransferase